MHDFSMWHKKKRFKSSWHKSVSKLKSLFFKPVDLYFYFFRWARSTTEAPPVGGENDGDLAASGDRSFAYTERVLFSPESRARVHLPPATIPIIDRAINDRSTNISGQRSFSERVGQASAVISDAAESGPFSLPFGLRLKNGGGNNGTGGRKVRN